MRAEDTKNKEAFKVLLRNIRSSIELFREEWSIRYLDIDNNKPDNALKEIPRKLIKYDIKIDKNSLIINFDQPVYFKLSTAKQYLENLILWNGKRFVKSSEFFLIEVLISTIQFSSL